MNEDDDSGDGDDDFLKPQLSGKVTSRPGNRP